MENNAEDSQKGNPDIVHADDGVTSQNLDMAAQVNVMKTAA